MDSHVWVGPQEPLGHPAVVASELVVRSFAPNKAEGTFAFIDYAEHGIRGEDSWEAERIANGEDAWTVRCTSETIWVRGGEKFFTMSMSIHRAIQHFISKKLELLLLYGKFPDPVQPYRGRLDPYTGPCVCDKLAMQPQGGELSWDRLTEGRQYPNRLHECHCGKKWWNYDEDGNNSWAEIGDEPLWADLIAHNGKPSIYLGEFDRKVYSVQTLRNMGYIPL